MCTQLLKLNYDEEARIISVWWGSGSDNGILIEGDIAAMMGCKSGYVYRKKRMANECDSCKFEFSPNMNAGYEKLYIYCSLCSDRVIGDTLAPLLLDIPVPNAETTTKYQIDKTLLLPQYIPVRNTDTDEIEINIRSGDGSPIPF